MTLHFYTTFEIVLSWHSEKRFLTTPIRQLYECNLSSPHIAAKFISLPTRQIPRCNMSLTQYIVKQTSNLNNIPLLEDNYFNKMYTKS